MVNDDRSLRRLLLSCWKDASGVLHRLAVVMWTTGAVLFAVGWLLDSLGWWEHRPFLTNIISAFTSAFFAIPVALLVIDSIARRESRWSNILSAVRLMMPTLTNLIETASELAQKLPGEFSLRAELAQLRGR